LTAARQPEDWRKLTEVNPTVEILRGRWFPPATSYRQVVKVQAVAPNDTVLSECLARYGGRPVSIFARLCF